MDGTRLLSRVLVSESHTKQPNAGTYALGWQHTSTADPARIGHDGTLTRYSAREDPVPENGYAVAVLLDSYTPTYDHPFAISTGLIDISDGRHPELGTPLATIIDLGLGAVTVIILARGTRGLRRSERWAQKRGEHHWWRRILRLLPQAIMPALTTGITAAGVVGLRLIAARVRAFLALGKGRNR